MCLRKWFALCASLGLALAQATVVSAAPSSSNRIVARATSADLMLFIGLADDFRIGDFGLAIRNKGPDIAQNVVFRFTMPEGTALDQIICSVQSTCTFPPSFRSGEIVCAIGDVAPSALVQTSIRLSILASPGTRLAIEAHVSSDTPDMNLADNVFSTNFAVPGFPRIDSVRALKNPFRIEVTGKNLLVPQFGGSGVGVGCDCTPLPFNSVMSVSSDTFVIQGSDLKNQFPKGEPTPICYFDPLRGLTIKTTFTR
jgi:uncharacterized protein DUF11